MAMAQQFPTTAQVIYDTLAADATFTAFLGTYDFNTGDGPLTALSVVSAGEDLPAIRNVEGVECIIQDAGNAMMKHYLSDEPGDAMIDWSVFLVAWGPAKGADLQAAANRIMERFVGSTAVQTVATSDGLGALVQTKVMISSFNAIKPL